MEIRLDEVVLGHAVTLALFLLQNITGDSVDACPTLTAGQRLCDQSKLQFATFG